MGESAETVFYLDVQHRFPTPPANLPLLATAAQSITFMFAGHVCVSLGF